MKKVWDILKNVINKSLIWYAIFTVIIIGILVYIFSTVWLIDKGSLAVCITGLTVLAGYFITHYLEIDRKIYERKQDQYLEFLYALRMFLNENKTSDEDLRVQRERFQKIYFQSTLLISSEAYNTFKKFLDAYKKTLKNSGDTIEQAEIDRRMDDLNKTAKELINKLRKEFKSNDPIDFELQRFNY